MASDTRQGAWNLVDDQAIVVLQGGFHTLAVYLVALDDEGIEQESDGESREQQADERQYRSEVIGTLETGIVGLIKLEGVIGRGGGGGGGPPAGGGVGEGGGV